MQTLDVAEVGLPQTVVLYATRDRWRYSIYTDRLSLEGVLSEWVTPDRAQREAAELVSRAFGRPLELRWDVFDPGWWVAHVEPHSVFTD